MTTKIEKKILSVSLVKSDTVSTAPEPIIALTPQPVVQRLNENLKRPDILHGKTYKIKPPVCDSALYITINNIVLNEDSDNKCIHPFEIFIASKNMAEYQWVTAFTRVASAVFRKGGDVTFIVEELKSVQDPNGGYFSKHGRMLSVVAEIGHILEKHFKDIGLIENNELLPAVIELRENAKKTGAFANGTDCKKCGAKKAVILLDGCPVCVECGDSKCG